MNGCLKGTEGGMSGGGTGGMINKAQFMKKKEQQTVEDAHALCA